MAHVCDHTSPGFSCLCASNEEVRKCSLPLGVFSILPSTLESCWLLFAFQAFILPLSQRTTSLGVHLPGVDGQWIPEEHSPSEMVQASSYVTLHGSRPLSAHTAFGPAAG